MSYYPPNPGNSIGMPQPPPPLPSGGSGNNYSPGMPQPPPPLPDTQNLKTDFISTPTYSGATYSSGSEGNKWGAIVFVIVLCLMVGIVIFCVHMQKANKEDFDKRVEEDRRRMEENQRNFDKRAEEYNKSFRRRVEENQRIIDNIGNSDDFNLIL